MGLFDAMKGGSDKNEMRPSPVQGSFGQELYAVDCRGANLYVHEKAVVIDKTGGGLWNLGIITKVIPFKSIVAVQAVEIDAAERIYRIWNRQQPFEHWQW